VQTPIHRVTADAGPIVQAGTATAERYVTEWYVRLRSICEGRRIPRLFSEGDLRKSGKS
jgi:hypothetical protein